MACLARPLVEVDLPYAGKIFFAGSGPKLGVRYVRHRLEILSVHQWREPLLSPDGGSRYLKARSSDSVLHGRPVSGQKTAKGPNQPEQAT